MFCQNVYPFFQDFKVFEGGAGFPPGGLNQHYETLSGMVPMVIDFISMYVIKELYAFLSTII